MRRLALVVAVATSGCAGPLVHVEPVATPRAVTLGEDAASDREANHAAPLVPAPEAGLAGVVERLRGLRFRTPVPVRRLAGADFDVRVTAATASAPVSGARRLIRRAFGIGPAEQAPRAAVARGRYVGLYDFRTHELLVRDDLGAREDGVVAHELVHALQDQHFGLEGEDAPPDEALALEALYEGDAVLLRERLAAARAGEDERAFLERALSAVDRLPAEEIARAVGASPRVLSARKDVRAEVLFPYVAGFRFAARRYLAGGNAALDAVYADPPRSTCAVLHPESGAPKVSAAIPDDLADASTRIGEGVLGEARTAMVLARCGVRGEAGTRGFEADRFVVHGDRDHADAPTTLVWLTAWRSNADAARFASDVARARVCFPAGSQAFEVSARGARVVFVLGPRATSALVTRAFGQPASP